MDETADDSKDGCALTVGSLFSGIGGLDLGFERAGFNIAWQCEKDSYCHKVLNKHWPNTPCYDNIEDLHRASGPEPEADILIGGFPCQDISIAGEQAGLDGERSGLWWEFHRLIRMVRPRYAVVENVPGLLKRGMPAVLGSLSEIGYDAEWQTLPVCAFGAPHTRERVFIVGYPNGESTRLLPETFQAWKPESCWANWWSAEPEVDRVAYGVPDGVDRHTGLGNAVSPAQAEYVAMCVREHAKRTRDPQREK